MENLNLIEDINKTQKNNFLLNSKDTRFELYLELLNNYYKEFTTNKFRIKYDFYINDNGDFEKKSVDNGTTTIINKPKFINIAQKKKELREEINNISVDIKKYQEQLLDNNIQYYRDRLAELKDEHSEIEKFTKEYPEEARYQERSDERDKRIRMEIQ